MLKPMLCATVTDVSVLRYPLVATPKLDGIRAVTCDGVAYTRSLKLVQNRHIQRLLATLPSALDGELICGAFNSTSSAVMRRTGTPDFEYHVFDLQIAGTYKERQDALRRLALPAFCRVVPATLCDTELDLLRAEESFLHDGYEGAVTRNPSGLYLPKRSTMKDQGSCKLKRFADSEMTVIGFAEQMQNNNEQQLDERGYNRRPGGRSNHTGKGTLGSLLGTDCHTGLPVRVGSGMDDALRQAIWDSQSAYLGRIVRYKHQLCGALEAPRFPVFVSFMEPE